VRKYNFILTKDTAPIFIHRINKLLSRTGSLVDQSIYTGAKNRSAVFRKILGRKSRQVYDIIQSSPVYWVKDKVKIIVQADRLYIDINSDCGYSIPYDTKMFFTSNSVSYKPELDGYLYNEGRTNTIKVHHNLLEAVESNDFQEWSAEQYWKDVEAEWDQWIDKDERVGNNLYND